MRIAFILSCAAALGLLSAPALSAEKSFELTEMSGKVLVTTENGALPAALGQRLNEGMRIFVGHDAVARVTSADGACNVALPPKKVTVVNYKKMCDVQIIPTANDRAPGGLPPPVVGLTFFGTIAAAVIYTTIRDNDDDPVSTR